MKKTVLILGLVLCFSLVAQSQNYVAMEELEKPSSDLITVTGILTQTFAVGGETTGWVIKLELPLYIFGKILTQIELDLGERTGPNAPFYLGPKFNELRGFYVEITGYLTIKPGTEKESRWVLLAKSIKEKSI